MISSSRHFTNHIIKKLRRSCLVYRRVSFFSSEQTGNFPVDTKTVSKCNSRLNTRDNKDLNIEKSAENRRACMALTMRIRDLRRTRQWEQVLQEFRLAKLKGVVPDQICYNAAISVMSQCLRPSNAVDIFEDMKRTSASPSEYSYGAVIDAHAKCGDVGKAMFYLNEMTGCGIKPNIYCFNSVIHACAVRGDGYWAMKLLDRVREAGLKPDIRTYSICIRAAAKSEKLEKVLALFDEIIEDGLTPNQHTYAAVIDVCGRNGNWQMAVDLYNQMIKSNMKPDELLCSCLVNALLHGDQIILADQVIARMKTNHISLGKVTYHNLICAHISRGRWEAALEATQTALDENVNLSMETHTALIVGAGKAGEWKTAEKIFNALRNNSQVCLDECVYNRMLDAYWRGQQPQLAEDLHKLMVKLGLKPNISTFNCQINALCSRGLLAEARNRMKQMQYDRISPDLCTFSIIINAYHSNGYLKDAYSLYEQALKDGLISYWSARSPGRMDLHEHNIGMAYCAIYHMFENISKACRVKALHRHNPKLDLEIITGHPRGREWPIGSVLQPAVKDILTKLGLDVKVDSQNLGLLTVSSLSILEFIAKK